MSSATPGEDTGTYRHRISTIKLQPLALNQDITLKLLVDGREAHRLALIKRGEPLSWEKINCEVRSSSRVELRVYEKKPWSTKRIGTLDYAVKTVQGQPEASFEFDTKRFTAVISFPTREVAKKTVALALAEAETKGKNKRLLERLGPTRDVVEIILSAGEVLTELHPAAKIVFGFCNIVWKTLEKQEECDANVEDLVVGLAGMFPLLDEIENAVTLPQLKTTMAKMMGLVEDALIFIEGYKSDGGFVQGLRAVVGSKAQDQVQDLQKKFEHLKAEFGQHVTVQIFQTVEVVHKTVDAVHGVLLTNAQRALLNELKPVGSARYDTARVCLSGTRTAIINRIVDWSQKRDTSEGLLWVHGQAGLGKSSIAASVCHELDGKKLLGGEFFCKRDSPARRDPQQVLTTIVYGLASRHSEYAKAVAEAIQEDAGLCSSPMQKQYDSLVKSSLKKLSKALPPANFVVVVDALDECGTNESRRELLANLNQMSQLVPWLKLIITSRPDQDIQSFFDDRTTSRVSRESVSEYNASSDIKAFFTHRMHKALTPDEITLLTERADGLFIWAKTACELLLSDFNPTALFTQIISGGGLDEESNPLDTLYTTAIETSLGASGGRGAQYVRDYLGAIIVCSTRTPLSVASLSDLLGDRIETRVLQSVVGRLGSVLYTDHAQGGVVRVYHHSFTDYMTTSTRSKRFCVDLERQNTEFAGCCLRRLVDGLRFNICGLETSHVRNSQVPNLSERVDVAISPLLRYSCLYWISHLIQSKRGELEDLLSGFLLQPKVLYWIEVLSLLGKLDAAMFSALELSKWCLGLDDIHPCARDIYRFIMAFYDPISESTPHLYVSALAFCPIGATLKQRLQPMFQNTLTVTRGGEAGWSPWLRCISHPAYVLAIAVSKDGRRIVAGASDKMVRMWDADTGRALGEPLVGHSGYVTSVGFSPDGRRIVSGSNDKTVRVWDADTGEAVGEPLVGHSHYVTSVGFSPDGRRIVSGSGDMTVRVWDADAGTASGEPLVGHSDYVTSVGFSPDGRRIVSGSNNTTVRVWDADTGTAVGEPLVGHSHYVTSVGFSPDGRRIISGSYDKTVRVWDADAGTAVGEPLVGHSHYVTSVGFSPDGRRIVSGSYDMTVRVWDSVPPPSGRLPHNTSRMSDRLSPDGWLRSKSSEDLLIWLPEEYRRRDVDDSLLVISKQTVPGPVSIDSSRFMHGLDWASTYTP